MVFNSGYSSMNYPGPVSLIRRKKNILHLKFHPLYDPNRFKHTSIFPSLVAPPLQQSFQADPSTTTVTPWMPWITCTM